MDNNNPPPRPGNYDRSWNDPPLFSYASGSQNPTDVNKQGTSRLNKRVEFPSMSKSSNMMPDVPPPTNNEGVPISSTHSESKTINSPLPPPMVPSMNLDDKANKPLQVLPYDYKNTSNPNKSHADCDSSVAQKNSSSPDMATVINDFNKVLENAQSEIDKKKLSDIKKRVGTMETKWKTGVLNAEIQSGMAKMAESLLKSQEAVAQLSDSPGDLELKKLARDSIEEAEKIQRGLMVDWPSLCGTWMVGIKHLVQELKRIHIVKGQLEEEREAIGISVPL